MYNSELFKVELFNQGADGTLRLDISEFVQGVGWKSSLGQVADIVNFEIVSYSDENSVHIDVPVGSKLRLSYSNADIVHAVVTSVTRNVSGSLSVIASDNMYYLTKNMTTYPTDRTSGKTIITDVLEAFQIPCFNLPEIGVLIKNIYRDMSLWNIIQAVFKEEQAVSGAEMACPAKGWQTGVFQTWKRPTDLVLRQQKVKALRFCFYKYGQFV